jgi:hypothetical protein
LLSKALSDLSFELFRERAIGEYPVFERFAYRAGFLLSEHSRRIKNSL